jgi:replicative DNA helicase
MPVSIVSKNQAQQSGQSEEDSPKYRVMPHNEEAEQALLGAILVNNKAYEKVADFLRDDHFFNPVHARIYRACEALIDRAQIANPITLKTYFESDGDLEAVGGADYLADLAAGMITIINADDYGKTIYDLYLRRQLIELGEEITHTAYDSDIDHGPHDQIEQAESQLFGMVEHGDARRGFVHFKSSLAEAIDHAEAAFNRDSHVSGVTTGLTDLDKKLGGMHSSDLLILAGRPSMGKTALATTIAFNSARAYMKSDGQEGGKVAFFSLEMSSDQLATRILSAQSRVESDRIRRGDIRSDDFKRFVSVANELSTLPFFIDDTPALSISAIRTRARRLKRKHGLDLLVVDYLQLLRGSKRAGDNRVQEISEISQGLKAIAKELDIPVLALSQLSRAVEQRENKRPLLSDLRESGSIEQDADVVAFVYRDEYYLSREEPKQKPDESDDSFNERYERWRQLHEESFNKAECIIAKQRHGPIGTVELFFNGKYTQFDDLDTIHSA